MATQKTAKASKPAEGYEGFSEEERLAMKEHAKELKAATKRSPQTAKADEVASVLEKIAEMTPADRALAEQVHTLVTASAPGLSPKLWYGMPAYAKDGKIICFFKPAQKFKVRYAELGFNDAARLDDGTLWPTAFALTTLTAADEARIKALVKKAAS